jgi:hypothetical protein
MKARVAPLPSFSARRINVQPCLCMPDLAGVVRLPWIRLRPRILGRRLAAPQRRISPAVTGVSLSELVPLKSVAGDPKSR